MELALRQVPRRVSYASNYIVFDNVIRRHRAVSERKCYAVESKYLWLLTVNQYGPPLGARF
jgi:hypothetical protein